MLRCAARPLARVATRRAVRPYHQEVIDHFEKPLNVGSLDKDAKDVGTGLVGAPACGDVMKLQIKVRGRRGALGRGRSGAACSAPGRRRAEGPGVRDSLRAKRGLSAASTRRLPAQGAPPACTR